MNVAEEIESVVARETATDSPDLESRIDAAITTLLGPNKGDSFEHRHRQYVVRIGGLSTEVAEKLRRIRALEIAAAPEVLALISADNLFVLVGRYWACGDERLLEVDRATTRFTAAARERFRRDMVALADQGYQHAFAGRGYAHWRIGETSGTIVLNAWTALSPLPPEERDGWLRRIDYQLTLLKDS